MGLNFSSVLASCVTLCKVVDISESQIPLMLNEVKNSTLRMNHPAIRICNLVSKCSGLDAVGDATGIALSIGATQGKHTDQVLALRSFYVAN